MIKLEDFLDVTKLGDKFVLVKDYVQTHDFTTKEPNGYRCNISIQGDSDYYLEMIEVKIKNTLPTFTAEMAKNNKTSNVQLLNLSMGQYQGKLWFTADDISPVK